MSATEIKKHLHQYIDTADQRFLNMIYVMVTEYSKKPVTLSREEKIAVDKGIDSIEKGNFLSNDQVISSLKKKYTNLKIK